MYVKFSFDFDCVTLGDSFQLINEVKTHTKKEIGRYKYYVDNIECYVNPILKNGILYLDNKGDDADVIIGNFDYANGMCIVSVSFEC